MTKPLLILLLSLTSSGISINTLATADIVIIANKSLSLNELQTTQAKKLWLGEIHKLPGTGKIKVVDQSGNSTIKENFYAALTNKTLSQLKVYWAKIIFTGKAIPPKTLSSDKKVIDFISKHKKFLGYIDSKSVTDDVKVLMSIK